MASHPQLDVPEPLKGQQCSAVVVHRGKNRHGRPAYHQCTRWAASGSAPFCGMHTNWRLYSNLNRYPRVDVTIKERRLSRKPGATERVLKYKLACGSQRRWVPVTALTGRWCVDLVNQWDREHNVAFKATLREPVEGTSKFYVRWKHYPAAYDTLEPASSFE